MKARFGLKPREMKILGIAAGAVLLTLVLGYLVLIGPQRSRASELDGEIAATEQQIVSARAASQARPEPTRVDQLFRLTKAMPDRTDMPGMLLELSRIAAETGINFESITPSAPAAAGSFQTVPVQLAFQGNYYELSDFLFRLRSLVTRRSDGVEVSGRLYSIDGVDFSQGDGSTQLAAKVSARAYVYGTGSADATAVPPATVPPATTPPETTPPATTPPAAGATG